MSRLRRSKSIEPIIVFASPLVFCASIAVVTFAAPAPTGSQKKVMTEFLQHLDQISSATREVTTKKTDPKQLYMAVFLDKDEKISGEERPTLTFRFNVLPWREGSPGRPDNLITLASTLTVDDKGHFVLGLSIPGKPANVNFVDHRNNKETPLPEEKVQILVVRKEGEPPSEKGRLTIAKLWRLIGENIRTPYKNTLLEAVVMGVNLQRSRVPALYTNPGSGSWTLFKIFSPGEAYLAVDLEHGEGEFFPKVPDEPSDAGKALFHAL